MQTFMVSEGKDPSTPALLHALAGASGRPAPLVSVPPAVLRQAAALVGKSTVAARLLGSVQVDPTKIRGATGWHPPLTVEEGIRRMAGSNEGGW